MERVPQAVPPGRGSADAVAEDETPEATAEAAAGDGAVHAVEADPVDVAGQQRPVPRDDSFPVRRRVDEEGGEVMARAR